MSISVAWSLETQGLRILRIPARRGDLPLIPSSTIRHSRTTYDPCLIACLRHSLAACAEGVLQKRSNRARELVTVDTTCPCTYISRRLRHTARGGTRIHGHAALPRITARPQPAHPAVCSKDSLPFVKTAGLNSCSLRANRSHSAVQWEPRIPRRLLLCNKARRDVSREVGACHAGHANGILYSGFARDQRSAVGSAYGHAATRLCSPHREGSQTGQRQIEISQPFATTE